MVNDVSYQTESGSYVTSRSCPYLKPRGTIRFRIGMESSLINGKFDSSGKSYRNAPYQLQPSDDRLGFDFVCASLIVFVVAFASVSVV